MANLNFPTGNTATFPSVYQLETTDPVVGGANGISNQQAKELGERTEYLKYRQDNPTAPDKALGTNDASAANTKFVLANAGRYSGIRAITTNATIVAADAGKLVVFTGTGNSTATLPAVTDIPEGMYIAFTNAGTRALTLQCAGIDLIANVNFWISAGLNNATWVMPGETISLVRVGSTWHTVQTEGNFRDVGQIAFIPAPQIETAQGVLEMKGQLVNRADYPRLFSFVVAYQASILVADASWAADKAKFSLGNGSSTFRLPDLRGQFIRSWDNAAGIDSGRAIATTQADELKAHTHSHNGSNKTGLSSSAYGTNVTVAANLVAGTPSTGPVSDSTGGAETRPRNMAYNAVIKY